MCFISLRSENLLNNRIVYKKKMNDGIILIKFEAHNRASIEYKYRKI